MEDDQFFLLTVATSTQNNPPDEAMQSPQEKFDRLMNAIFLKTFNLRNYEEDPLSAGEILLFTKLESIDLGTGLRQQLFT